VNSGKVKIKVKLYADMVIDKDDLESFKAQNWEDNFTQIQKLGIPVLRRIEVVE